MVDPCEDNCRMKHKLNKNSAGLDYLPNFLRNTLISSNEATELAAANMRLQSSSNNSSMNDLTSAATTKATVLTGAAGGSSSGGGGGGSTAGDSTIASSRTVSVASNSERY